MGKAKPVLLKGRERSLFC